MGNTVWIIAGEESGDGYGARLARELRRQRADVIIRGMGGGAMSAAGVDVLVDSSELGIVGLVEVFRHLGVLLRVFRMLVRRALEERPDVVVLIDYPGFNLRFAKKLHAAGIPVVYYVSPQIWAWKRGRRHRLAACCRRLLCIFPFEPEHYADTALDVHFVGHPLIAMLEEERDPELQRDPNLVLLLPGSRRAEIDRLLQDMLRTAAALHESNPDLRFVMPLPRPAIAHYAREKLQAFTGPEAAVDVDVVCGETRRWMQCGTAGLAASGTVTMEAAILGLPLVSIYRLAPLTYMLSRLVVRQVRFFTIVNLIAGREIFEEFLQNEVTPANLVPALRAILPDGRRRGDVIEGMAETVGRLVTGKNASVLAANAVLEVADDASRGSDQAP